MSIMLELINEHILAHCKVCGEPIKLNVTLSAPIWEQTEPPLMAYSPRTCPRRLAVGNPAKYGPGMSHIPEFRE